MLEYKRVKLSKKKINKRYIKMKNRYMKYIGAKEDFFVKLFFSIMIMEDYNRPWYLRILEYIVFILRKFYKKKIIMSLGIMQVKTSKIIGNKKSIELAEEMIKSLVDELYRDDELTIIKKVALSYNPSQLYYEEITKIYKYIK